MRSSIIENPPDSGAPYRHFLIGMSLEENRFATVPISAREERFARRDTRPEADYTTVPMSVLPAQQTDQLELEDGFATTPLFTPRGANREQLQREEEWHTSFEDAISKRVASVSQRLSRLSTTSLDLAGVTPPTPASFVSNLRRAWRAQKRQLLLVFLGFCLFLLGFDLLGLLMLLR